MLPVSILLALASLVSARKCVDTLVDVSLSSTSAVFNLDPLLTEIDVTNFYLNLARQGFNATESILGGYTTIQGQYQLATTYCEPDNGPGEVLQLMTHGIGFDRSYWDLPFNNYNYSYVARAVDEHGYSTLTWDRLGVGQSSRGDPISEIQIYLEIAALRELTAQLSRGSLCGAAKYDRIVHVGHSFGSAITYNLVNMYPDVSDGIVLTGFSQVPNYLGLFALGGNFVPVSSVPALADSYPPGYVAAGSKTAVHINFFAPDNFDPALLDYAYENGQPNTPGEISTVGSGAGITNVFQGPSIIVTGDRDVPFCGGDCLATSAIMNSAPNLIAASEAFFPSASPFNATVIPGSGHGLNLEYSAGLTYTTILDFLDRNL